MKKEFKLDKNKMLEALEKRAQGFFYSEEILEYGEASTVKSDKNSEKVTYCDVDGAKSSVSKKKLEKSVSKNGVCEKNDIYSERETNEGDVCNDQDGNSQAISYENTKGLVLLKKKVTTHYIPPDITAVKMLIEIAGEEIGVNNNIIESLSDDELLKLKRELIEEIKNE